MITKGTRTLRAAIATLVRIVPRNKVLELKLARSSRAITKVVIEKRMVLSTGLRLATAEIPMGAATPKLMSGIAVKIANCESDRFRSDLMALI